MTRKNLPWIAAITKSAGIGVVALAVPTVLAVVASIAEGASCALFIPALQALHGDRSSFDSLLRHMDFLGDTATLSALPAGLTLVGAMFLCAATKIAATYLSSVLMARALRRFVCELRIKLLDKLLSLPKTYFDSASSGKLQELLTSHVSSLAHSLTSLHGALFAVCCISVYATMLIWISWTMTLCAVAILPIISFGVKTIVQRLSNTSLEYTDQYNEFGRRLSNALGSIALIKAYGAERIESSRFHHQARYLSALEFSLDRKGHMLGPIQEAGTLIVIAVLLVLFSMTGTHGPSTLGQQLVYLVVLRRMTNLLSSLSAARGALATTHGAMSEIADLLRTPGRDNNVSGPIVFDQFHSEVSIRSLTFRYGNESPALQNISFDIPRGSFTGIIGASGAGKSTLVGILLRLYDPPPGTVFVDGHDLLDLDRTSWLARVAYVSQETYMFHGTARENLLFGLSRAVSDAEIRQALDAALLTEVVATFPDDLDTILGERGVRLSGGERQRFAIARALLKNADIWILDEPTSALDTHTEQQLADMLDLSTRNKTVITIAHRLSTLQRADTILVLSAGALVEQGSPKSLGKANGPYARFLQTQGTTEAPPP